MPVYLPPLTRRQFLARSFAAGAGVMLSSPLFSSGKTVNPHRWALIADPHIAANRARIAHDINMTEQFMTVVEEVLAQPQRPVAALINGDLAFNTGETDDYAAFGALIEPLRAAQIPLHLGLGNHDHRERFWAAMIEDKTVTRPLSDRQASIIRSPRANWFMLDSLDKTMSTPGVLGPAQLTWLAQSLDANADKPALVMVHHNPNPPGSKAALVDTDEFFEIIRPRRHVKAYIFGHTHRWSVTKDASGLHLVNLPTTAYVVDRARATGWVLANLEENGMCIELRCLKRTHPEHGRVVDLPWRS